ncbi:MAG: hypothetical protein IT371_03255 [Deltaproteobacteria bacterium]|nr:hypothetical protein [Deltaproteobacteria bacterium]
MPRRCPQGQCSFRPAILVIAVVLLGAPLVAPPGVRAEEPDPPATISATRPPSFRPGSEQPLENPFVLRLMDDPGLAEEVLARGKLVRPPGRPAVKALVRKKPTEPSVMFRLGVQLPPHPPVEVFFKPRQRGYRDWATETAVCRLARHLRVRIAPCHERVVPRKALEAALPRVPEQLRENLLWEEGPEGPSLYGFFRVWAPAYVDRLGTHRATRQNLLALASFLAPARREEVRRSALLQEIADVFVLDFLVYNNDRRRNLGSVRHAPDGVRLFAIDFGDGLSASPRKKRLCKALLAELGLFRRTLVERIRHLTEEQLVTLWHRPNRGWLVEREHVAIVLAQKRRLLEHVARRERQHGAQIYF